jgi:hypothetical protein
MNQTTQRQPALSAGQLFGEIVRLHHTNKNSLQYLKFALGAGGLEKLLDDLGVPVGQDALARVDVLLGALADHRHVVDL